MENSLSLIYSRMDYEKIKILLIEILNYKISNKEYYENLVNIAPKYDEVDTLVKIIKDKANHINLIISILNDFNLIIDLNNVDIEAIKKDTYINYIKTVRINELEYIKKLYEILSLLQDDKLKSLILQIIIDDISHIEKLELIICTNLICKNNNNQRIEVAKEYKKSFTLDEAKQIAKDLKIDFNQFDFDVEEFRKGLNIELEHGKKYPFTNITNDDSLMTAKIALIHLFKIPDYYTRLIKMQDEGYIYWSKKANEEFQKYLESKYKNK